MTPYHKAKLWFSRQKISYIIILPFNNILFVPQSITMVFGHHDMTIITKNNCAAQSGDSKPSVLYPKCKIEMRRPHFSNASTLNVPIVSFRVFSQHGKWNRGWFFLVGIFQNSVCVNLFCVASLWCDQVLCIINAQFQLVTHLCGNFIPNLEGSEIMWPNLCAGNFLMLS